MPRDELPPEERRQDHRSEAGRLEIARQIDLLADALARVPGVTSVVLMGSAARNEHAWTEIDGRPQLFSDLEFLAVTETRLPAARRREAEAALSRIAAGFGQRSRLFHADVLFREAARLPKLPRIIFTYELASMGRPLRGAFQKSALPTIDAKNLDLKNTREILMKRLWATAESIPGALLQGEGMDAIEARSLGVSLCRNPLDVPTVLLPSAGILEAGYEARQRVWARHPELAFRVFLDERFGRDTSVYLRDCLALRRGCAAADSVDAAHRDAITLIAGGLDWLSRMGDGANERDAKSQEIRSVVEGLRSGPRDRSVAPRAEADGTRSLPRDRNEMKSLDAVWLDDLANRVAASGDRLFNARPIARGEWLAWLMQGVRFSYSASPRAAKRWWTGSRKGQLCAALLQLHRALPAVLAGDIGATRSALDQAMRDCATVVPLEARLVSAYQAALVEEDASLAWLAVRAQVGRLFWRVIRLGNPAAWQAIATSLDLPEAWR